MKKLLTKPNAIALLRPGLARAFIITLRHKGKFTQSIFGKLFQKRLRDLKRGMEKKGQARS